MSLRFKVYDGDGDWIANFKHDHDAAYFVAGQPNGATIRTGYRKKDIVWTEGHEEDSAARSFNGTVEKIQERIKRLKGPK